MTNIFNITNMVELDKVLHQANRREMNDDHLSDEERKELVRELRRYTNCSGMSDEEVYEFEVID